jgi:hypothetical protein
MDFIKTQKETDERERSDIRLLQMVLRCVNQKLRESFRKRKKI